MLCTKNICTKNNINFYETFTLKFETYGNIWYYLAIAGNEVGALPKYDRYCNFYFVNADNLFDRGPVLSTSRVLIVPLQYPQSALTVSTVKGIYGGSQVQLQPFRYNNSNVSQHFTFTGTTSDMVVDGDNNIRFDSYQNVGSMFIIPNARPKAELGGCRAYQLRAYVGTFDHARAIKDQVRNYINTAGTESSKQANECIYHGIGGIDDFFGTSTYFGIPTNQDLLYRFKLNKI
jgi:hypothetical protein